MNIASWIVMSMMIHETNSSSRTCSFRLLVRDSANKSKTNVTVTLESKLRENYGPCYINNHSLTTKENTFCQKYFAGICSKSDVLAGKMHRQNRLFEVSEKRNEPGPFGVCNHISPESDNAAIEFNATSNYLFS